MNICKNCGDQYRTNLSAWGELPRSRQWTNPHKREKTKQELLEDKANGIKQTCGYVDVAFDPLKPAIDIVSLKPYKMTLEEAPVAINTVERDIEEEAKDTLLEIVDNCVHLGCVNTADAMKEVIDNWQ